MVRILARFSLSRPCSTPLLVVAHSKVHAISMLSGIRKIHHCGNGSLVTAAQGDLCSQLYSQVMRSAPPPGSICSIWFSALSWAATVRRGAEQCRGTSPVCSTSPASSIPHLQLLSSGVLVRSFENMLQPVAPAASIIHSTATCRHLYSQCWLSCPLLTCIRTHGCQRVIAVLKCSMRMVVVVAEEHKHMKDQSAWQ